jgi:hypothetical protein
MPRRPGWGFRGAFPPQWGAQFPNPEFIERDPQAPPAGPDTSGAIAQSAADALARTPYGEPPLGFDVRCVYDSRLPNAFDFNFSGSASGTTATALSVTFTAPAGYRAVPREWSISFEGSVGGSAANSTVDVTYQGAAFPYNNGIIVGTGTSVPIKTFFVVDEQQTFGINANNRNAVSSYTVIVVCYGNLIPVTGVALPYTVTNASRQGQ